MPIRILPVFMNQFSDLDDIVGINRDGYAMTLKS